MKTFFTRILSTALCFILAFAVIQPAFAEGTDDFVDYDAPYIAFLQQMQYPGLSVSVFLSCFRRPIPDRRLWQTDSGIRP